MTREGCKEVNDMKLKQPTSCRKITSTRSFMVCRRVAGVRWITLSCHHMLCCRGARGCFLPDLRTAVVRVIHETVRNVQNSRAVTPHSLTLTHHTPTPRHSYFNLIKAMIAIPTSMLVACVISSLCLHSCAWVANIRPAYQNMDSSSDRSCFRARVTSGSRSSCLRRARVRQTASSEEEGSERSAMAGKPEEKQLDAPVEQQPWWEEERKTKGLPTLSRATQWRMFLSLKVIHNTHGYRNGLLFKPRSVPGIHRRTQRVAGYWNV